MRPFDNIIRTHTTKYPVRIGALAGALGLRVKTSKLPVGIIGQIARYGDIYVIKVERSLGCQLQRYAVAHECAHFILHQELIEKSYYQWIRDDAFFRSPFVTREQENEAHQLAMEILVPLPLLATELAGRKRIKQQEIARLADLFGVAESRMEIRLGTMERGRRITA